MLLDLIRPIDLTDVGYHKLLIRGGLLVLIEAMILYVVYQEENPTSFVYMAFGGFIFASKLRLRPSRQIEAAKMTAEEKRDLQTAVRDNKVILKAGVSGRTFYFLFAVTTTVIFVCSLLYDRLSPDSDVYPVFQIKPEESKTKFLLMMLVLSWGVLLGDWTCGREYHWNELMVYQKLDIKKFQIACDYTLMYLIFSFSQQIKMSIFSLIFFFFVLVTISVFLFSLWRDTKKGVSFDRYISFLKWLTLSGMIVIYTKKSYQKFIEIFGKHSDTNSIGKDLKDLIDQFIDKEENFDRILVIFILSSLRQYFADIGNMIKNIKGILDDKQTIEAESLFVTFFSENILLLMDKRGGDMLRYDRRYRFAYMYQFERIESIRLRFSKIFEYVIVKSSFFEGYLLAVTRLFRSAAGIVLSIMKTNLLMILQLALSYIVIMQVQYSMIMILPIVWCMLSMIASDEAFACNIAVLFLYIPTCFNILQTVGSTILCNSNGVLYKRLKMEAYCYFMTTYPVLSDSKDLVAMVDKERERLFYMLTCTIVFVILQIERKNKIQYVSAPLIDTMKLIATDFNNALYDDLKILYKFALSKVFSNFYYVCLLYMILTIIRSISFFNFICIVFFFYFILNSTHAKRFWIYLLLYLQFLLIVRFLHSLKIYTFNLDRETLAMIGLFFGTGDPATERDYTVKYWIVLILVSVQYLLFFTKIAQEYEKVELELKSSLCRKIQAYLNVVVDSLRGVYEGYMVYIYHMVFTYIIISSEFTCMNVLLLILEMVLFINHMRVRDEKKVYRLWYAMCMVTLLFSIIFYIVLFMRYTCLKPFVSDMINTDHRSTLINEKTYTEMTMAYLFKQQRLEIDEEMFMRENMKILLSFISLYYINNQSDSPSSIPAASSNPWLTKLGHIYKAVILLIITFMTLNNISMLKIIFMVAILYVFYHYIKLSSRVINQSSVMKVLYLKILYINTAFIKKFNVSVKYSSLDIDAASDSYRHANDRYYKAIIAQFYVINKTISGLIHVLIFRLAVLYFVYCFLRCIFSVSPLSNSKSEEIKLLSLIFNWTNASNPDAYDYFKKEMVMAFVLILATVVDLKLSEAAKIDQEQVVDLKKDSDYLTAHLNLYLEIYQRDGQETQVIRDMCANIFKHVEQDRLDHIDAISEFEVRRKYNNDIIMRHIKNQPIDEIDDDYQITLPINESAHYRGKVLFFNQINHIYMQSSFSYEFIVYLQRLILILLLTIVSVSPSIFNICLCIYICVMELTSFSFIDYMSSLTAATSMIIIKDLVVSIVHSGLLQSTRFSQAYDSHASFLRLLLNYDMRCVYLSICFIVAANIFITILLAACRYIVTSVDHVHVKKKDIYWRINIIKTKSHEKRRLIVDHRKWSRDQASISATIGYVLYSYPLEIYVVVMTMFAIYSRGAAWMYLIPTIIPYIITFLQLDEKYMKLFYNYYFLVCMVNGWLLIIINSPFMIMKSSDNKIWESLRIDISLPTITLINKMYRDILSDDQYIANMRKIKKYQVFSSKLSNYCSAYEHNDKRLLSNVRIFNKQQHIISIVDKLSQEADVQELNKQAQEQHEDFNESIMASINPQTAGWSYYKIYFNRLVYDFLLKLNFSEVYESVFYLYCMFKRKNRRMTNHSIKTNINDHLKYDIETILTNIDEIIMKYKTNEQYIHNNMDIQSKKILDDLKCATDKDLARAKHLPNNNNYLGKRTDISHSKASQLLFDRITQQADIQAVQQQDEDDIFIFSMNEGDDMVFMNIQPHFIEQTDNFTTFNSYVFLRLFFGMLISNMHFIVIALITSLHLWAGGLYSIIIITLIFFILVEQRVGKFRLWMIIAIIYLVVLSLNLFLSYFNKYVPQSSAGSKARYELPGELNARLVLLIIGKIESKYMICFIFFLIIILKINYENLGYFNQNISEVETVAQAAQRIIINEDYNRLYDDDIRSKCEYAESLEDIFLSIIKKNNINITWNYLLKIEREKIRRKLFLDRDRSAYQKNALNLMMVINKHKLNCDEDTDNFEKRNLSIYVLFDYLDVQDGV